MPLNGPELREARARAGFATTEAFAHAVGASPRAVQDWELGKSMPQPRYRARINDVLQHHPHAPVSDPESGDDVESALSAATHLQLLTELAKRLSRLAADGAINAGDIQLPTEPLRWPRTDQVPPHHQSPPKQA